MTLKFLVLQKSRRVPVEIWAKLFPAHLKYLDDIEKEGKIEISYHLVGQQGNLLIVKVDSDEELTRIIGDDPLFFYSEREIYPLISKENHKKYIKQILGRPSP